MAGKLINYANPFLQFKLLNNLTSMRPDLEDFDRFFHKRIWIHLLMIYLYVYRCASSCPISDETVSRKSCMGKALCRCGWEDALKECCFAWTFSRIEGTAKINNLQLLVRLVSVENGNPVTLGLIGRFHACLTLSPPLRCLVISLAANWILLNF